MKRIGIYSGTFDPVHNGHIAFALKAATDCNLDKIYFLVEPRPRRKHGVKALEHRIAMVKAALAKHDELGIIVLEQARFTVHHTLPILRSRFAGNELHFLMGEDFFGHLASWPHVDDLLESVSFIIGMRESSHAAHLYDQVKHLEQSRGLRLRYDLIVTEASDISSSAVKAKLRTGKPIEELPKRVLEYIRLNNLYVTEGDSSE